MTTLTTITEQYIWLVILVAALLLPFTLLALRKLGHILRLLGLYIKARKRQPWTRQDMTPAEVEDHFSQLSSEHEIKTGRRSRSIDRLHWETYLGLQFLRRRLSKVPASMIGLVPSSQWFFDNFNLFYRELMKLSQFGNLKKFRRLPVLASGGSKGYPRIYQLAREIISCSNNHLNEDRIFNLIKQYQGDRTLLASELWVLPDALALGLLERIVDQSKTMLSIINSKREADKAANRLSKWFDEDTAYADKEMASRLRDALGRDTYENQAFVSQLCYRFHNMSVSDPVFAKWLGDAIGIDPEESTEILEQILEKESEQEARAEAMIRQMVGSLNVIIDIDWNEQLHTICAVDQVLSLDPAGIYSKMDSQTRSQYRQKIEKLAKCCGNSEQVVAKDIVSRAKQGNEHVGRYLFGESFWETLISMRQKSRHCRIKPIPRKLSIVLLPFLTVFLTACFTAVGLWVAYGHSSRPGLLVPLGIIIFLVASSIAIRLIQDIGSKVFPSKPQLAMNFQTGIPKEDRTVVVMPVLLTSPAQVEAYISRLEKHYLANRQDNLHFAILGDYQDAPTETLPSDQDIIRIASNGIECLNERYPDMAARFMLLYRPRLWNPKEVSWMGWERKRGKLEQLNALIMGENDTGYEMPVGQLDLLRQCRYVITLDADTELILESAVQLVSIMAHPINRPQIDIENRRITSGCAIVQPQILNRLPGPAASIFSTFFTGPSGLDRYATVISDVYQDVFSQGTFVGKGIYDVEAVHQLLSGTIPENAVLSHDLLEGSLTRCAFDSSVKMMDRQLTGIVSYIRREHRWIRGDWQLLPWLFRPSSLNRLSKWKIIDNLRRSLVTPAQLAFIILCATVLTSVTWLWLPFVLFEAAYHILSFMIRIIIQKNRNPSMRLAISGFLNQIVSRFLQFLIELTLIPSRSLLAVDAIIRTLYRLLISHKRLLEWQTAEAVEKQVSKSLFFHLKTLWPAGLPAGALIVGAFLHPSSIWIALLFVIAAIWLLSPFSAWLLSLGRPFVHPMRMNSNQEHHLRMLARRTWNYFEDFSTEKVNWLCPDNYQLYPGPKLSDKTSPTNIGLQLLSVLSAHDLGFVSTSQLIDHCERVLMVCERLPKWHGHLFNWYNVETLHVLEPQYVSTVDSGNFIAHILCLKNGLKEQLDKPVLGTASISGLRDSLTAAGLADWGGHEKLTNIREIKTCLMSLLEALETEPVDEKWRKRLERQAKWLLQDADLCQDDWELNQLPDLKLMENACDLVNRIEFLTGQIDQITHLADFKKLYDPKHHLFSIGYHVSSQTPDQGRYDLMASEARLTSFLAVAKGDVPKRHWDTLGRPFTLILGTPAMLSWSGSMFEYLMPNLVMRTPPNSIFEQSCRAAVNRQVTHGKRMKQPWGVSESQYYAFDVNSNYQYTAFGVKRLKLQSSMHPARVVAPYATLLALMVKPGLAMRNINRLHKLGASGEYGFYEALDFSRPDMSNIRPFSLVQSAMVHHLGMSLVAIDNHICKSVMLERFHQEPMIQAADVLLEETAAAGMINISRRWYTININVRETDEETDESRFIDRTGLDRPVVHVLTNRNCQLMLTSDGEGFMRCDGVQLNRWRPDQRGPGLGNFVYIRNLDSQDVWSSTFQPTCCRPDSYQVVFSQDKAEFRRRDGDVKTKTEVILAPFDDLEIKRVTLSNQGDMPVLIELTSYQEVVADLYQNDAAHPAFSKLFIETHFDQQRGLLVAHRRKRKPEDNDQYMMHRLVSPDRPMDSVQYETDRRTFIGRSGSLMRPQILQSSQPMGSRTGFSPDPILSLRTSVEIMPGRSKSVIFLTGISKQLSGIEDINRRFDQVRDPDNIFIQALTSSRLRMRYLSVKPSFLNAVQNLLAAIYYPDQTYRGPTESIERSQLGQSGLWRFGISGDKPIILLRVDTIKSAQLIRETLLAFEVMRVHHIDVDLVIFNCEQSGYAMNLNHLIQSLTSRLRVYSQTMERSGIHMVNRYQMSDEEADLLCSVARIMITPESGLFFKHLSSVSRPVGKISEMQPLPEVIELSAGRSDNDRKLVESYTEDEETLEFANGLGGFQLDGREYVVRIRNGMKPPSPWINVIANDHFGFQISESGAGYTWAGNSHENKLTVWSNDPVLDPASEAIYIKDQATGAVTSPCLLDAGVGGHYKVRHGLGYSVFEHAELGIKQALTTFVACRDPVRLWQLKLTNSDMDPKVLSVTFYVEWVLGVSREASAPYVVTRFDRDQNCLIARNAYLPVYRDRPAFIFCSETISSATGDRRGFLGPCQSIRYPHGLALPNLSGDLGAGLDPCGAVQMKISLDPNESKTLVFGLGQMDHTSEISSIVKAYTQVDHASRELERVKADWQDVLGGIQVHTPDRSIDILMNSWLRYQVLSCRLRARAAFDQCGGAIGFRDQLQDVMAFMHTWPTKVRDQILMACSHQFADGDVQHWWHPPTGLGVRTRISDDLLWLPYVTCAYISQTGDDSILQEDVSWIEGDQLLPHEHEKMITPTISADTASVYQHCLRAIERASKFGDNGLPLMGGGDWNDGMNMVGIEGRGESVWLGWFLYSVLHSFAEICRRIGRTADCRRLSSMAANLTGNLESSAWDGQWYRRAFFDNGQPVGSSTGKECQIDSISQSWAVLSGAASPVRAERAMMSALEMLVDEKDRLVLLLKPPFDKSEDNPGYIRGYYPGVRENGGQYTHAAIWLAMASAKQKLVSEAWRLLGILNPIHSTDRMQSSYKYGKEPYVMPADICSADPYRGRAGWSWYTGSAGWMYQAILRSYLGIERAGNDLVFDPCIARGWTAWSVDYTVGSALYKISFTKDKVAGLHVKTVTVDGSVCENKAVRLVDDGRTHQVDVVLDDHKS